MCESCLPRDLRGHRVTRRQVIGGALAGAAAVALGPPIAARANPIPVADDLTILPRSAWAGTTRPPTGPLAPEDVRFLLVHHTASGNGSDPVSVMRGAYDFHTGPEKGWPDVAYNFFIDQNGVVWEGREGSLAGPIEADATGGSQGFAQLVCLLGDFTSVLPTPAALDSLNRTLAWLAKRYSVATEPGSTVTFTSRGSNLHPAGDTVVASTISGHRDMSATACPGDTFYPYLVSAVPGEVNTLTLTAPPELTPTTPPAAETTVATSTTQPPPDTTQPGIESTTSSTAPEAPSTTASSDSTAGSTAEGDAEVAAAPVTVAVSDTTAGTTEVAADGSSSDSSWQVPAVVGALGLALAGSAAWYVSRRDALDPDQQHPPDDAAPADDGS